MIDPEKITNFNRSNSELEELFLFAVLVAGKNARMQAVKLEAFLAEGRKIYPSPFGYIYQLIKSKQLVAKLEKHKLGKYRLLSQSFEYAVENFSGGRLMTATCEELEKIPGVGLKTARFFLLHSRPDSRVAVIDTHLLKYLKREYTAVTTPSVTPADPNKYKLFEGLFLGSCLKEGVTPYHGDLTCWITKGERIK